MEQKTKQKNKISEKELLEQHEYEVKLASTIVAKYGEKPLACVVTFGCQQNVADSEKIKGMLSEMGYGFTDEPLKAKLILFNTCAVREHAEQRVFGNVGALKQYKSENKDVVIALCGCMMQQQHIADKIKKSFPFVDLVFGTHVVIVCPNFFIKHSQVKKEFLNFRIQTAPLQRVFRFCVTMIKKCGFLLWKAVITFVLTVSFRMSGEEREAVKQKT